MIPASVLIAAYAWVVLTVIILLDSINPVSSVRDFFCNFLFIGLIWPIIPLISVVVFVFEWWQGREGKKS